MSRHVNSIFRLHLNLSVYLRWPIDALSWQLNTESFDWTGTSRNGQHPHLKSRLQSDTEA